MSIVSAPLHEVSADAFLCLGIKPIGPAGDNQRHCGIIYRRTPQDLRFLHLAFHFDLRDDAFDRTYWWAPSGLDPVNQRILAAFASLILMGDPAIPYGFDSDGIVFDRTTGELYPPPVGKGLTCATFVLAVFRTYGFEPLLDTSWEARPDDAQWQQKILSWMEESNAATEHLDAIRAAGEALRYRPEEVVGCAVQAIEEWSIDYQRALALAAEVLADLVAQ